MTVQGNATASSTATDVRRTVESAVIRFAGDSGDGIQVTGSQFGLEAAIGGADIATFPDYPSEIRAPQGSVAGVSSFQLQLPATTSTRPATASTPSSPSTRRRSRRR